MPLGLVQGVLPQEDSLDNLLVSLAVEGRVATQENVQNDATAPQVALMIVALLEDLGRDIVRRSELLTHHLTAFERSCRAEVDDGHAGLVTTPIEQ